MVQDLSVRSVSTESRADIVQSFANRHRLKIRVDEDGTRIIPGKLGQIYEYDDAQLAVMVMPVLYRKNYWGSKRNKLIKAASWLFRTATPKARLCSTRLTLTKLKLQSKPLASRVNGNFHQHRYVGSWNGFEPRQGGYFEP